MELNPVEAAPHERAENQNPMPNPPITTHIETARAAHDPNAHNYIVWIQSAVNPDGRREVVNASTSVCALQPTEAATLAVLYLADKLEETGRKPADGTVYRLSVNETGTDQTWSMELTYHERDNADHPPNAKDASTGEADPRWLLRRGRKSTRALQARRPPTPTTPSHRSTRSCSSARRTAEAKERGSRNLTPSWPWDPGTQPRLRSRATAGGFPR